jgi:hypothetical protein
MKKKVTKSVEKQSPNMSDPKGQIFRKKNLMLLKLRIISAIWVSH